MTAASNAAAGRGGGEQQLQWNGSGTPSVVTKSWHKLDNAKPLVGSLNSDPKSPNDIWTSKEIGRNGMEKVKRFLEKHGFKEGDANACKSSWFKFNYPLHVAVKQQDATMVRLLMLAGADRTLRNSSGFNPVDKAWKYRRQTQDMTCIVNSIKVLLALGVELPDAMAF